MKEYIFKEKATDYIKDENKLHLTIVGSRSIIDKSIVKDLIDVFIKMVSDNFSIPLSDIIIVSGGAKGIDTFAHEYARENDFDVVVIKPDWEKYGKGAGFKRNSELIKLSDVVLAIVDKDTGGTWDTIRKAEKLKIPVYVQRVEE